MDFPLVLFARLSKFIVFFAALQIIGGPWAALQSIAWVTMIADYSRADSLGRAMMKTFDGDHPCHMCQDIKAGRSDEQKRSDSQLIVKAEAVLALPTSSLVLRSVPCRYVVLTARATTRSLAPPTPPPRLV